MKNVSKIFFLMLLAQPSLAQSRFLYDQSGNRTQRIATSDLTPSINSPLSNFTPSGAGASRNFTVIVQEVAGQQTSSGNIMITIRLPLGYTLSFDNSLTTINVTGGSTVAVDNNKWTVDSASTTQIILKINFDQFIAANSFAEIGFTATRNGASTGSSNMLTNIFDDPTFTYDSNSTNNIYARSINSL